TREIGGWEAAFANVTQVSVGLMAITTFVWEPYIFPGASVLGTIWITAAIVAVINIMYVLFAIQMPRSGGDYVYVSRTLHPALGFAESFMWVFFAGMSQGFVLTFLSTLIGSEMFHTFGVIYNNQSFFALS